MPLYVAVVFILAALASPWPGPAQATAEPGLRLDLPFTEQVKEGCGSAAISMVMNWWKAQGHPISGDDVAAIHRAVYSKKAKGTPAIELEQYFERHGFRAYAFAGGWEDLTEHLGKGRPLLVALRPPGQRQLHYVVVSGVSPTGVLLHDPARKPFRFLDRAEFEKQWAASQHWTLLALPAQ